MVYSVRKFFTGIERAALIALKLIVNLAVDRVQFCYNNALSYFFITYRQNAITNCQLLKTDYSFLILFANSSLDWQWQP